MESIPQICWNLTSSLRVTDNHHLPLLLSLVARQCKYSFDTLCCGADAAGQFIKSLSATQVAIFVKSLQKYHPKFHSCLAVPSSASSNHLSLCWGTENCFKGASRFLMGWFWMDAVRSDNLVYIFKVQIKQCWCFSIDHTSNRRQCCTVLHKYIVGDWHAYVHIYQSHGRGKR